MLPYGSTLITSFPCASPFLFRLNASCTSVSPLNTVSVTGLNEPFFMYVAIVCSAALFALAATSSYLHTKKGVDKPYYSRYGNKYNYCIHISADGDR